MFLLQMNLSSVENMSSINPILEHIFNTNIIIPGIEDFTQISPIFFFIICQNEGLQEEMNYLIK